MKCPKCQFENRESAKFCLQCGESQRLQIIKCSQCGKAFSLPAKFCDDCGQALQEILQPEPTPLSPVPQTPAKETPKTESERKHITVLFSDLSGYTAMCEKLDPEEVKEIMARIFGEIAQIVARYEGFIDKFIGDAVMALFGVPQSHEDDPVRAIKTAREIHDLVAGLSPRFEQRLDRALTMHSGISTGLVVTGELDVEKGRHGIAGDTINLAARLSGLARAGEILIGPDTHHRAEGYFNYALLEAAQINGKAAPVTV